MSDPQKWIEAAKELGKQHGTNAAGWWIQEVLTKSHDARERALMTVYQDEIGDPAIALPTPDLSGQWADSLTAKDILTEILGEEPMGGADSELEQQLLDAYEEAFSDAARDECIAACRNELVS